MLEAKGHYVNVTFDGRTVHFKSKAIDRDYSISQIASISFQEPTFGAMGFAHFRAAGDLYKVGKGPNAVHFKSAETNHFRALVDAVRAAIAGAAGSTAPATTPSSTQDDVLNAIKKLGDLRDAGVVTSEEFETKKAELLARI